MRVRVQVFHDGGPALYGLSLAIADRPGINGATADSDMLGVQGGFEVGDGNEKVDRFNYPHPGTCRMFFEGRGSSPKRTGVEIYSIARRKVLRIHQLV